MTDPTLTRRRLLQGVSGAALVGLAGCTTSLGGSGDSPDTTTAAEDPAGHGESAHHHDTVSEPKTTREILVNTARGEQTTEYHFNPHVTWVTVGGTVRWVLESGTHTATAYHPGNDEPRLVPERTEAWDSGTLAEEGATFEHTFDTEGVYHYFCKPHEQYGMIATVIVGQPHPEEQAALQNIPEGKPDEVVGKLRQLNEMCRSILGDRHHEEETTTHGHGGEDGHHEEETTTHGHGGEDGHHEEETTTHGHGGEDGHHEEETTTHGHGGEDGHHEETTTA